MHEKRIVICHGPADAHAFDGIPKRHRHGELDAMCPACQAHGQWNGQIDLASHRSIRVICERCDGRGWIETGDDPVPSPDTELTPEGYPRWVTRLDPPEE
ncbi:MAG: hypothetical protein ACKVPY_17665 [Paracoccaceae bacterium]